MLGKVHSVATPCAEPAPGGSGEKPLPTPASLLLTPASIVHVPEAVHVEPDEQLPQDPPQPSSPQTRSAHNRRQLSAVSAPGKATVTGLERSIVVPFPS